MIDASTAGFGKFVPGFDFLQNLVGSAAKGTSAGLSQMPNLGNWVAPTLSVEELDKRIEELKAVQFWLDQNAVALKATIQALEVQKMTVATLKGLNVNLTDLAEAFKFKMPTMGTTPAATASAPEPVPAPPPAHAAAPEPSPEAIAPTAATASIDPLKWWGALTEQFQAIATTAVNEVAQKAAQAAKAMPKVAPAPSPSSAAKKTVPRKAAAKKAAPKPASQAALKTAPKASPKASTKPSIATSTRRRP